MEFFSLNKSLPGRAACSFSIAARRHLKRVRSMDEDYQDASLARALSRGAATLSDKAGSGVPMEKKFSPVYTAEEEASHGKRRYETTTPGFVSRVQMMQPDPRMREIEYRNNDGPAVALIDVTRARDRDLVNRV
jgi:hypothetical protein